MRIGYVDAGQGPTVVVDNGDGFVGVGDLSIGQAIARMHDGTLAVGPEPTERQPSPSTEQLIDPDAVRWLAPVSPSSGVWCVGRNYRAHVKELHHDVPAFPTLFGKYHRTLIGPGDSIVHPPETKQLDWEGELVVVVGAPVRRADSQTAEQAIAGFMIANDVTARDWQYRTSQWLQGKNFEGTCPVGPWITGVDEVGTAPHLRISTTVSGSTYQDANTSELIFGCADLVSYISQFVTLNPGDIILTGTPAGVGYGMEPQRFLEPGDIMVTEIEGLGRLTNKVLAH